MIKEKLHVESVITSPPYWNMRDYEIEPSIWDGDPECEHDFEIRTKKINPKPSEKSTLGYRVNGEYSFGKDGSPYLNNLKKSKYKEGFCSKCGAWKGSLGLEPTFELYIKHLCDIYDLIWEVLKPTGTNWVNIGDTYSTQGGQNRNTYKDYSHYDSIKLKNRMIGVPLIKSKELPSKCLCLIPQRFAIEMVNRGWILRNVIIWHKPNSMPSSAKDRFTVNFEYIYFFVKSNKTRYWVNEKTCNLISKKPLGIKGIENSDWEWRECPKCEGTGIKHKKCSFCDESSGWYYDELLRPRICPKCNGKGKIRKSGVCKRCKGNKVIKYNFWKGKQYFFEQQIESYEKPLNRWGDPINKSRTEKKTTYENMMKLGSSSKLVEGNIRPNPMGKNKRCVWSIPTKPNPESHFATFSPKLIEPMIKAGCPKYVCKKCGKPREKIYDKERYPTRPGLTTKYENIDLKWSPGRNESMRKRVLTNYIPKGYTDCECTMGYDSKFDKKNILPENATKSLFQERKKLKEIAAQQFPKSSSQQQKFYNQHKDDPYKITKQKEFKGFTDCNHGDKWKLGIVLDPFAGIGTTLLTAWKLGRNFIGFEISKEYCKIANKKLFECKNKRLDEFIYPKSKEVEV